jgi:hypothetical protein
LRRHVTAIAAIASVCALAKPAHAYRPFDGTDADTAELGEFELELGPSHFYVQGAHDYLIAPATVLNFGIFDHTELVIDFDDFVALNPDVGAPRAQLLDTDVLLKHVFRQGILQGGTGLSVAVEAGPLVPEINGTNAFGASADTILSYQWPALTVHFNEWLEYTREHNPYVFSGALLEGPHDWTVRPVAELYYSHEWNVGDEESALVGAIWTVKDSLAFDAGVRVARVIDEDALEVRLGLTWAIPMWEHAENAASRLHPHAM